MWTFAGILVIVLLIAAIDIPSLTDKKKDLWAFSILLLLGTGISVAEALHVGIPNPLDWIAAVYQPFSNWITSALK
jgi:hypothetical protein